MRMGWDPVVKTVVGSDATWANAIAVSAKHNLNIIISKVICIGFYINKSFNPIYMIVNRQKTIFLCLLNVNQDVLQSTKNKKELTCIEFGSTSIVLQVEDL